MFAADVIYGHEDGDARVMGLICWGGGSVLIWCFDRLLGNFYSGQLK
jgi:hypothetical protein